MVHTVAMIQNKESHESKAWSMQACKMIVIVVMISGQ